MGGAGVAGVHTGRRLGADGEAPSTGDGVVSELSAAPAGRVGQAGRCPATPSGPAPSSPCILGSRSPGVGDPGLPSGAVGGGSTRSDDWGASSDGGGIGGREPAGWADETSGGGEAWSLPHAISPGSASGGSGAQGDGAELASDGDVARVDGQGTVAVAGSGPGSVLGRESSGCPGEGAVGVLRSSRSAWLGDGGGVVPGSEEEEVAKVDGHGTGGAA